MSTSPDIRLDRVSLAYGRGLLVKDLSVEFPRDSFTCLLGPSGIGKSTLLRFIAGLSGPDVQTGSIGTSDDLPLAGRVGWLAQEPLLLPWLNVIDNVCIGTTLRGQRTRQSAQKAQQILQSVGLNDALEKYPAQLSGGMQSRTALARTLFEEQPVVLMDEPFSTVDAISRNRLQSLACHLLRRKTVVLVTHDPFEALRVADQIYVLNGHPATLSSPIVPPGPTPRDSTEKSLNTLHAQLMHQLDVGFSA